MKYYVFVTILLMTISGKTTAQNHTTDEADIKQTISRFEQSWAKADFSDMKDYMTPDCNWINIVGMHWHNLNEVQYAHQAFIQTALKGTEVKELNTMIRLITPEVAVVYLLTHISAFYPPDGINRGVNKQGDKDNIATMVLVKQNGKWLITSAQNSDVIAQAAPSNPVLHMK